jgi:hypothetical protein
MRTVPPGLLGIEPRQDQPVDLADVHLANRLAGRRQSTHEMQRVAMADRLEMVV